MRTTIKIKYLIVLPIFLVFALSAGAQSSIGSGEEPLEGVLLQLKNIDNVTDGSAYATKGLLLPRMELQDINNLYPMFSSNGAGGYTGAVKTTEDPKHEGLMVYNLKEDTSPTNTLQKGVYVWTGSKWISLTEE